MPRATRDYFTGLASDYDANRPSYPVEAIDAILADLPRPARVADIGCGTGISSRLLASRGVEVIGIDPNQDMLEQARQASGAANLHVEFCHGTGEDTGLNDVSVDVVVCAQAFHWLRPLEALREFHRILKPHGRLALVWNVRNDGPDPFTAAYSDMARRAQADAASRGLEVHEMRSGDPTVGGFFGKARPLIFPNPQRLSLNGLLGRARSASYFPKPDNPLRGQMESELRRLFEQHSDDGAVTLWHRTEVTLATRRDI
jgi:ubiquinone/menaquinone biosynthesis C-methylase UbiE